MVVVPGSRREFHAPRNAVGMSKHVLKRHEFADSPFAWSPSASERRGCAWRELVAADGKQPAPVLVDREELDEALGRYDACRLRLATTTDHDDEGGPKRSLNVLRARNERLKREKKASSRPCKSRVGRLWSFVGVKTVKKPGPGARDSGNKKKGTWIPRNLKNCVPSIDLFKYQAVDGVAGEVHHPHATRISYTFVFLIDLTGNQFFRSTGHVIW